MNTLMLVTRVHFLSLLAQFLMIFLANNADQQVHYILHLSLHLHIHLFEQKLLIASDAIIDRPVVVEVTRMRIEGGWGLEGKKK
jgi:hypothetical protein